MCLAGEQVVSYIGTIKGVIMSSHLLSIEDLIKVKVKFYAKENQIALSQAYKETTLKYGFQNHHEFTAVLKQKSYDSRVYKMAFEPKYGFEDLLFTNDINDDIYNFLEDAFSSDTASMNASGYEINYEEVTFYTYDPNINTLLLTVHLSYVGEPDSDRMYSGHEINAEVRIALNREGSTWVFNDEQSEVISAHKNTDLSSYYDDDY